MLWFFERHQEELRLEARYDNDATQFVILVHHPDGTQTVERFDRIELFGRRLTAIEAELEGKRWTRAGPPVLLPDGWPDKPLT